MPAVTSKASAESCTHKDSMLNRLLRNPVSRNPVLLLFFLIAILLVERCL